MLQLSVHLNYLVYQAPADMRKSFDGLSGLVRNHLGRDPMSQDVFVFFNRKATHVKVLHWEGDGFAVYHKRLEQGAFEVPKHGVEGAGLVSAKTLQLILQGVVLASVKHRKRYVRAA